VPPVKYRQQVLIGLKVKENVSTAGPRVSSCSRKLVAQFSLHGAVLLHPPYPRVKVIQDEVNIARAVGGGVINS